MKITKREKEVITKLAEGLTVKEVASSLYLSPYTIESHKKRIYEKLNARTLTQLGAMAVRSGIIAALILITIVPSMSQSQFEIDGTIKATGLIGSGNRAVVADDDGMLKVIAQDPAIMEIKDSTGDVRFRFDANQGLFQMLLKGDTLRETQIISLPQEANFKSNLTKSLSEEAANALVFDGVMDLINSIASKFGGTSIPAPPVITISEKPEEVTFQKENGEHNFHFQRGGNGQGILGYSGLVSFNGFIKELEIATNFPVTATWKLKFSEDKLLEAEYIEDGQIGKVINRKIKFDENCNLVEEIETADTTSHKIHNPNNNSFTSIDGQNIVAEEGGANPNGKKSWTGINNGTPNFGAQDNNNQVAGTQDALFVINQNGNTAQQVMLDKDGFQAVKDHDVNDPNDTPQFLGFQFDFENNRILVCGDVHLKGNVTATGSITGSSMLINEITKSKKSLASESLGSGNIITDENGIAKVVLPAFIQDYFTDFRYQLTTIGSFSQVIVNKELENGIFEVASTEPNVKVSWEISGMANQAYRSKITEVKLPSHYPEIKRMNTIKR